MDTYKKKFRIRFYSNSFNEGPIFLETKGRNLERTYKRRVRINFSDIETKGKKK